MNLTARLQNQIADPTLTRNERARLRCQLSKALEQAGDYEGARQAMGELWKRVVEGHVLSGLNQATKAEVLLRVGALTGCIGRFTEAHDYLNRAADFRLTQRRRSYGASKRYSCESTTNSGTQRGGRKDYPVGFKGARKV